MTKFLIGFSGGLSVFDSETDGGARTSMPGLQVQMLDSDPSFPARIYCATYNRGLWRSEDAGDTWHPAGTPQDFFGAGRTDAIGPRETTFVAVSPTPEADGRHAVWVGTEPSLLYRSTDHGETFELASKLDLPGRASWSFPPRPRSHHVQCIAIGADGRMHVAIEAGAMLRSLDGGRSFEDRLPDSPVDTHALRTHPSAPGRLYAALGDALLSRGRSFAESRDGGDTWHYCGRGLEEMPYLYGLVVNPADPEDLLVAASRGPQHAHVTGGASIFRRKGSGAFVEDADGFPRDRSLVPALAADPSRPGRWFALSNLGLFAKEPGATAWIRLTASDDWRSMHPTTLAILQTEEQHR